MNSNDEVRKTILEHFYQLSKNARNTYQVSAHEKKVMVALQGAGVTKQEVISGILYLVNSGFLKKEKRDSVTYYYISDMGVNHFEGASTFQKPHQTSGISIADVKGIVVVGNNNYVQQNYTELYKNLDVLRDSLGVTEELTDKEKLEFQSEIETIQSQLSKAEPNKTIIAQAWSSLAKIATVSSLFDVYERVKLFIIPFIT
ncbi:MAG: hypothetical protein RLZZ76_534 [Candidatus Parcubacteria bacterium]|jgi:hypothetical protein